MKLLLALSIIFGLNTAIAKNYMFDLDLMKNVFKVSELGSEPTNLSSPIRHARTELQMTVVTTVFDGESDVEVRESFCRRTYASPVYDFANEDFEIDEIGEASCRNLVDDKVVSVDIFSLLGFINIDVFGGLNKRKLKFSTNSVDITITQGNDETSEHSSLVFGTEQLGLQDFVHIGAYTLSEEHTCEENYCWTTTTDLEIVVKTVDN